MHENQTAIVEGYLKKLRDSDTANKAFALKSLSFLVTQSRPQLVIHIESVANELEEALNEVNIVATGLLEQLIIHYDKEETYGIMKRRLLRLIVRNLGDHKMQLRKMSHKCLVQFIKKYHDYDTLLYNYLKESIQDNSQSLQLKQKCLNSLQSILIIENKYLDMSSLYTKRIFQNIIDLVQNQQAFDVQKAAQQCLLALCRLKGIKTLIGMLSKEYSNRFGQMKGSNKEISDALAENKKLELQDGPAVDLYLQNDQPVHSGTPIERTNDKPAASRSFMNDYVLGNGNFRRKEHSQQKSVEKMLKIVQNQEITQAEQMLKRIEIYRNDASILAEIDMYIPTLENHFMNQRTQLFTISVRIIQVILEIRICESRYYVRLVPYIVERLNDQKFFIRNCINKMIKQYLVFNYVMQKTYTRIWIENFFGSLKKALSANFKQDLINLLIYGYQMFYPIEFDRHEAVSILAKSAADKHKLIRSKAIECIVLVLQDVKRPDYEVMLRRVMSTDIFSTVVQKLQTTYVGGYGGHNAKDKTSRMSIFIEDPLQYTFKGTDRRPHINTQQESSSNIIIQEQQKLSTDKKRYQSIKRSDRLATQEGTSRRPHLKKVISLEDQYTTNVLKLDDLSIQPQRESNSPERFPQASNIKITMMHASPTRNIKMLSDGIQYIDKDKLQVLVDPKKQVENLLTRLRDKSWKTQFEAVNTTRSLIEYHEEYLVSHNLPETVEEILRGVLSLRSSISKNSLMCLDELINKLKRRLDGQADLIVEKVMKKTFYTNEFLQGEVRKCLNSISNSFSDSKLMATLLNYRDHKSPNIKQNILIILQNIIRIERSYRKEHESIWSILISMLDEPSFEIRDMVKRCIQLILQLYPDCRNQLSKLLKKSDLDRVFQMQRKTVPRNKILYYESPEKENHILEQKVNTQVDEPSGAKFENKVQRSYTSPKKYSTGSAGSTSEFIKLEEIQKGCRNYKDWKNRMNCILDIFKVAFRYSKEFCDYSNSARYISLLCQHIEDPNVKVCINGLTVLEDSLIFLKPLIEDHLLHILLRLLNGIANKKAEISSKCQQVYKKLKEKIDPYKITKEIIKLCQNPIQKTRLIAVKQLDDLLLSLNRQSLTALTLSISKVLNKLVAQEKNMDVLDAVRTTANTLIQVGDRR